MCGACPTAPRRPRARRWPRCPEPCTGGFDVRTPRQAGDAAARDPHPAGGGRRRSRRRAAGLAVREAEEDLPAFGEWRAGTLALDPGVADAGAVLRPAVAAVE